MAEIVWTEPALTELDTIADYIALEVPMAAKRLVSRITASVEQLAHFPKSGSRIREWPKSVYRQLVVNPCRIFYRTEGNQVLIIFVMRHERRLRRVFLKKPE